MYSDRLSFVNKKNDPLFSQANPSLKLICVTVDDKILKTSAKFHSIIEECCFFELLCFRKPPILEAIGPSWQFIKSP
jgi:hypothetical protein